MHYAYTIPASVVRSLPASHATMIWSARAPAAREDRRWPVIARAHAAACFINDPAIGFDFAVGDAQAALREEAAFPADIVLYADQAAGGEAHAAGRLALRAAPPFPKRLAA